MKIIYIPAMLDSKADKKIRIIAKRSDKLGGNIYLCEHF